MTTWKISFGSAGGGTGGGGRWEDAWTSTLRTKMNNSYL